MSSAAGSTDNVKLIGVVKELVLPRSANFEQQTPEDDKGVCLCVCVSVCGGGDNRKVQCQVGVVVSLSKKLYSHCSNLPSCTVCRGPGGL